VLFHSSDGIEATLRLRARESSRRLSSNAADESDSLIIIGMSANSDAETRRLAHEAGMQYFLPKPFTIAEFRALIETIRSGSQEQ
jgi:CheY-like chemotaxis protein